MNTLRVALYGTNGHQIGGKILHRSDAELVATAAHYPIKGHESVPSYASLEEMLREAKPDLVSLCSPSRANQAEDAILCLRAGAHVYAEKPGALCEADLDRILAVSRETGREFHEMADTVFYEPYYSARRLIRAGKIGEICQIFAQKSYPMNPNRPGDETTDGGIIRWVGIHAVRFVEHVTGLRCVDVSARETHVGNRCEGDGLYAAAVLSMSMENGAVAAITMNYRNPKGFGQHGNEHLRVFGTEGMIEITDGGRHSHIYTAADEGEIVPAGDCPDFLDLYLAHLRHGTPMPMELEEELHPLRVVIRAKEGAITVR